VTTMCSYRFDGNRVRAIVGGLALLAFAAAPAPAAAQAADPNPGALTFSGAFDVPTLYYFRGIRQEVDPSLTMWPYADLKIDLMAGDGAVKSTAINFGVWNSLHTGSSGTDGVTGKLHYEEDFYAALTLGFARSVGFTTQWTSYTSPNGMFPTVKEILFKISQGSRYAPYGLIAFEVGGEGTGQADAGTKKGTYLEFGIGPSWPLGSGPATIAVPVKLGLSGKDYYEFAGEDNKFGYLDVGVLLTFPFTAAPSKFGTWNFHVGADAFAFGDMTEAFNANQDGETKKGAFTAVFGIGVAY
jgi:hypothetical protein